jgi:hypothetical protein
MGKWSEKKIKKNNVNDNSQQTNKNLKPVDFHGRNPITVIMLADSFGIIGAEWTLINLS